MRIPESQGRRDAAVGPLRDADERDADTAAEEVTRGPDPIGVDSRAPRKRPGSALVPNGSVGSEIGAGEPLPSSVKSYFEPRFGRDLGAVRLHTGPAAATVAHGLGARAFTIGTNIAFADGRYRPGTEDGRRLIAHELAHAIQQDGAPPVVQCKPEDDAAENPLAPDADARLLTSEELKVVAAAEKERMAVLDAAVPRLMHYVDLLRANASELRPMSDETFETSRLVRAYLQTRPSGWFGSRSLEFDWLNVAQNEAYLRHAMRALELMIRSRYLMLPKFHFLPGNCTPLRYARTRVKITLCPNFFGKGPDPNPTCPGWVLLHEYFHPLGLTHGEVSQTDHRMQRPGADQALQNANALASLAYELSGRDPAGCNAPTASSILQQTTRQFIRDLTPP